MKVCHKALILIMGLIAIFFVRGEQDLGFGGSLGPGVNTSGKAKSSISPKYAIIDIGLLRQKNDGINLIINGMSQNGNVAGFFEQQTEAGANWIGYCIVNGEYKELDAIPNAINNAGIAVGAKMVGDDQRACYWTKTNSVGIFLPNTFVDDNKSNANRITDDGKIIGWCFAPGGSKTSYVCEYDRNWVKIPDGERSGTITLYSQHGAIWYSKESNPSPLDPLIDESDTNFATLYGKMCTAPNYDCHNFEVKEALDLSGGANDISYATCIDGKGKLYGCSINSLEVPDYSDISQDEGAADPRLFGWEDGAEQMELGGGERKRSGIMWNGGNAVVIPSIKEVWEVNAAGWILGGDEYGQSPKVIEGTQVKSLELDFALGLNHITVQGRDSAQVVGTLNEVAILCDRNSASQEYEGHVIQNEVPDSFKGSLQWGNFITDSGIIACEGVREDGVTWSSYLLFPAEMGVDVNRDGYITLQTENPSGKDDKGNEVDVTTKDKPFRFWINDDDDTAMGMSLASGQYAQEKEIVPPRRPDYKSHQIISQRNLEDFSRLWIYVGGFYEAISTDSAPIQIGLKWTSITTGTPSINIYTACEPDGGDGYLTNVTTASAQITGTYGNAIVGVNGKNTVDASGVFIFQSNTWKALNSEKQKKYLLFEGAGEGAGCLSLVFLNKDGKEIGVGPGVWLDLKNIKKMYERGYAKPTRSEYPYLFISSQPPDPKIHLYKTVHIAQEDKPWDETPQCVVYVHGYNVPEINFENVAETTFKRLWWQGFKGRFGAFYWPTLGNGSSLPGGAVGTYNDSEYRAWNSADALIDFVGQMPYKPSIMAHSMGNIVTSEALRKGMRVNSCVMLHAATSASCYNIKGINELNPAYPITNPNNDAPDMATLEIRNLAYWGWLKKVNANITNFTDYRDTVITTWWDLNNSMFRPQYLGFQFSYTSKNNTGTIPESYVKLYNDNLFGQNLSRNVKSPAELKAYANYSLTGAIGRKGAVGDGSVIKQSVDTVNIFGFDDDHSWEWNHNIQSMHSFNQNLIFKLGFSEEDK